MSSSFWQGRHVFVTGAGGFIGSWLTRELLEQGASVVILIRDQHPRDRVPYLAESYSKLSGVVFGDLISYEVMTRILNEYEIDTCFHLAAQAIVGAANRSPLSTFESNIKGTWNILEAARNCPGVKRLIVASSDKAYGRHERLPYTEEHFLNPEHPYDVSKACADMLARAYFHTYDLPVAISRCANIYGPGDLNFSRIVPDTVRSALLGKDPVIRSDGTPIRDYMYVRDAVDAYLTLAEHVETEGVKGQAFNFGTQTPISVLDLVRKILQLAGRSDLKPVVLGQGKGEIQAQYLSSEKARSVLGWRPGYDLDAGLTETISWYRESLKPAHPSIQGESVLV